MSRLSKLIAELCPDGVEYRALGEVGAFTKGRGLQKKDFSETGVGCIHYGQIYTRLGIVAIEPLTYVSPEKAPGFTWVEPNDIVIAVTSENVDDVCKAVVWRGKDRIVTGAHAVVFHPFIDSMYVAYYLQTHCFNQQKRMIVDGVKVIEMRIDRLANVRIPVPPIEVQREIVRILDSFQELDDELTAEIEARERQLKELRLGLTDDSRFNDKQLMPLSRVALFSGGHTPSKVELDNYADGQSGISWITSKDVKRDYLGVSQITLTDKGAAGLKSYPVGTTVMVTRSGILRHYLPIASMSVESTVNQDIRCICPKEGVDADYVFEVLKARADYMLRAFFNLGGTVDSINFNRVKAMVIPVPDINEQLRIVDAIKPAERLLDLLRSERDARRKQFAYYRDKLLSFPEKVTTNG